MLYTCSCAHMTTVGVEVLKQKIRNNNKKANACKILSIEN